MFACLKIKLQQYFYNLYTYFWCDSNKITWFSIFFIFAIFLFASIKAEFLLFLTIFLLIIFILVATKSFKDLPNVGKKEKAAYEEAIKSAGYKEIGLTPEEATVYILPVSSKSCSCIFRKNVKIVTEHQINLLFLAKNHFNYYSGCTPFNLINPKRADKKKDCALVGGFSCGHNNEYYYSALKQVVYEKDGIEITFNSGTPIAIPSPKPIAQPIMKVLRDKLRQRM